MTAGFDVVLRGGVDAAWEARRAIEARWPALPAPARDDISLLVTELVTNAVRHGGGEVERPLLVELRRTARRIRVDVIDPGTEFDSPPRPGNGDSNGGWGLFLVDRVAERWGVCPAPAGTCVWFEVPAAATS